MNEDRNKKISKAKLSTTEKFKEKVKNIDINNEFEVIGEYINSQTNIKMIHHTFQGNHEFEITPNNFLKRKRCNRCNTVEKPLSQDLFLTKLYERYSINDIEVIGEYVNNKTPITIKCKHCGRTNSKRPVDLLYGNSKGKKVIHQCKCINSNGISKLETEVYDYIKSLYNGEVITNSKSLLSNKSELDIYIPDLKLAFEFNGLYWHSDYNNKDIKYHLNKTELCKQELGVQLIHIFEDEWLNKNEIVKSKISYLLKCKNNNKIYARKCYVEEIDNKYKNLFLNENHIQGEDKSVIKLGLWLPDNEGDTLVAVMTFCKPRTSLGLKNSIYDYELSRFATEKEYNIIGAFGKLFSYFNKNYDYNKIITYADRRWSEGKVYFNNNFIHLHNSKPNYFYFNKKDNKRYHRYSFRKNVLQNKFPDIYTDDKTEKEIMKEAGYGIIYDCGNMVFEYDKK